MAARTPKATGKTVEAKVEQAAAPKPVEGTDVSGEQDSHRYGHVPPAGYVKPKFPSSF